MGYTQVALEDKLLDMFPQIRDEGISPRMSFDEEKNAWVVKLVKNSNERTVYLDKKDADGCMDNHYCENFATGVGEAIKQLLG
jgi:hypothetical protein